MLICPVARPVTISSRLRQEGWDVALPYSTIFALKAFSPNRVKCSRPSERAVRSKQRQSFHQSGGPNHTIYWIFGVRRRKADRARMHGR